MRITLAKIMLRSVGVFIGILVIASLFQFGVWVKGPEIFRRVAADAAYEVQESYYNYFAKTLGFDRIFVPDLWPFDNESIWGPYQY